MSSLTLIPAKSVSGPLNPAGQRPGADSGDPQLGTLLAATDNSIGVWECQPGGWPVIDRPNTEVCFVLSGTAVITDTTTGDRHRLRAGDLLVLPRGWTGRWDVTETLRKVYAIY